MSGYDAYEVPVPTGMRANSDDAARQFMMNEPGTYQGDVSQPTYAHHIKDEARRIENEAASILGRNITTIGGVDIKASHLVLAAALWWAMD